MIRPSTPRAHPPTYLSTIESLLVRREARTSAHPTAPSPIDSPPHATTSQHPPFQPTPPQPPPLTRRCVVEMAAVLALKKPLIFSCGKVVVRSGGGGGGRGGGEGRVELVRGVEAFHMLQNCSELVDVAAAECAVPADKIRELATIGEENFSTLNQTVTAALGSGGVAALANVFEVGAFDCGEAGPLRGLEEARVSVVFIVACSAGQLVVLIELREARRGAVGAYLAGEGMGGRGMWAPVWAASQNGRLEVVEWLVGEVGASASAVDPSNGASAVFMAAVIGHLEVVRALLKAGASAHQAMNNGATPLFMAAQNGHLAVVRVLLVEAGARVHQANNNGTTPLFIAAQNGHLEIVRVLLVEAGASVNQARYDGYTALVKAAENGHLEVARALVEAGADKSVFTCRGTALSLAQQQGHQGMVDLLR